MRDGLPVRVSLLLLEYHRISCTRVRDIRATFKRKGQFTAAAATDEKINKPRGSPTGFSEPNFQPCDNAAR